MDCRLLERRADAPSSQVSQVFPDEYYSSSANPTGAHPLHPGEHSFPFKFKIPINNACSDPLAMSQIGGLGGRGGFGSGGGLFGIGGVRVMDGSKQLYLNHITKTLPPSLTAFPGECEIRYYIKVTVSRPGLLKENWRYQVGFKFLPIEPPRPKGTAKEAFARRPFTFRPRSPPQAEKRKAGLFSKKTPDGGEETIIPGMPPSIEISARLPHPSILTCNKPIPLRLVARKLVDSPEQVYLTSLQIDLIGTTELRSHTIFNRKVNRWVVTTANNLNIPLCTNSDSKSDEFVIPDDIWRNVALPNTIAPSFATCNLNRKYEMELKVGLSWGKAKTDFMSKNPFGGNQPIPQTIWLPLHFGNIEVYSGITPPPELVEAARNTRPGAADLNFAPRLPPRVNTAGAGSAQARPPQPQQPPRPANHQPVQPPVQDPLYPPQLAAGQSAPAPDDAPPPSYDEAIADNLSGPFDGMQNRPAYSGVTNENAPSQIPETKS